MTPPKQHFPTLRNANGGWYQSGKMFTMPKRLEIGYEYLDMCIDQWPWPSHQCQLAMKHKISQTTARKIIMELKNTGSFTDPELKNSEKCVRSRKRVLLGPD
jgi:hypothetical protein